MPQSFARFAKNRGLLRRNFAAAGLDTPSETISDVWFGSFARSGPAFRSLHLEPPVTRFLRGSFRLGCEQLELRETPSVASATLAAGTLSISTDDLATQATVVVSGSNFVVKDVPAKKSWTFAKSAVTTIEFHGGAGNDSFSAANLTVPVKAWGGDGNDSLTGGNGNDFLSGGAGKDTLVGGPGVDVLIAIDNGVTDSVNGGTGADSIWVDQTGTTKDTVLSPAAEDRVWYVAAFANGADRSLDGDSIADPAATGGAVMRSFASNPLFAKAGPKPSDVSQGQIGDCWLLAGLSAIAQDKSVLIRQSIVPFGDGTYGVALGGKFYRLDADLPTYSWSASTPYYAGLGAENSLWVALAEKAYAHYRTGQNSYASLNGGLGVEVNRAFGSTKAGETMSSSYKTAAAMATDIYTRWNGKQAVTIGIYSAPGLPLITSHMYSVASVTRNSSGVVTSITLRNPWGIDGIVKDSNPNDGLVTLTPAQLFQCYFVLDYGTV